MFKTFEEIIEDMMLFQLEEEIKRQLRSLKEDDLIRLHHSVGQVIRNEYNLWDKDNPLTMLNYEPMLSEEGIDYNPKHPDSVSMDIIKTVWKRLQ